MGVRGFNKYCYAALLAVLLLTVTLLPGCTGSTVLTTTPTGITDQEKQALIDRTVSYQTEGNVYHADSYEVIELKKGNIIYGMLPGQSVFYTDQATVDAGRGSYKTLYQLMQIRPHPVYGYRTKVGKYEVLEDFYVTAGTCRANREITMDGKTENLGEGGGYQYVIFEFEQKLKLDEEIGLQE
jgi:hypothetical protein